MKKRIEIVKTPQSLVDDREGKYLVQVREGDSIILETFALDAKEAGELAGAFIIGQMEFTN